MCMYGVGRQTAPSPPWRSAAHHVQQAVGAGPVQNAERSVCSVRAAHLIAQQIDESGSDVGQPGTRQIVPATGEAGPGVDPGCNMCMRLLAATVRGSLQQGCVCWKQAQADVHPGRALAAGPAEHSVAFAAAALHAYLKRTDGGSPGPPIAHGTGLSVWLRQDHQAGA